MHVLIRLMMHVCIRYITHAMPLNKIKSVTTQDLKLTNDHEILVFMKHGIKYEFSLFLTWGDFVNNGFIELVRLWVLSETDVTPPLPGNQTIDEY